LGACGLISFSKSYWRKILEIFVMLPGVLPPLFILLALLNGFSFFSNFPFGFWGVVIAHVVTYVGLLSVAWLRVLETKAASLVELATLDGARPFATRILIFQYLIPEAKNLFFLVFASSFTSFSIPLVVGGHRGETLDVLIYRAAFGQGNWGLALALSALQISILLILSFFTSTPSVSSKSWPRQLKLISMPAVGALLLLLNMLLFGFSLTGVTAGLTEILSHALLLQNLLIGFGGSLLQGSLVALFVFILSCLVIYVFPSMSLHRFLIGYVAPSTAITGVALGAFYDPMNWPRIFTLCVMALGFVMLAFPALYRLRGAAAVQMMQKQIEQARVLGFSRWQQFRFIALPQLWSEILFVSGVGAFWASGDFALARMISGQDITLALTAQTLLGGYRFEVATAIMWCSLLTGVFLFLICESLGRMKVSVCPS
jgi:thiamine transport system permease protein